MKLLASSSIVLIAILLQQTEVKSAHELAPATRISLQLVQPDHSFDVNSSIKVNVVIKNVGNQTILVCRDLDLSKSEFCIWNFRIRDAYGHALPGVGIAVDGVVSQRDDFATALIKNWLALAPGCSYTAPIDISVAFWKQPPKPGRYELTATLISKGPQADSIYNDLLQFPSDLKKLPYPGWVGKVESNAIQIDVARAKN